jgi:hypothetical protein
MIANVTDTVGELGCELGRNMHVRVIDLMIIRAFGLETISRNVISAELRSGRRRFIHAS